MQNEWKPGDPISSPVKSMLDFDFSKLDMASRYKLLISSVVPRPIAFVSTRNKQGQTNLAPFSYFNAISSEPATVMISSTYKRDGSLKDTGRNILETGEFVVNSVNEWILGAANHCSADYPYGVSEMERVGLTPLASQKVAPPRVKESAVQMECKLYHHFIIGPEGQSGASLILIGEVVMMHIAESIYRDGSIALEEYKPVARLGGLSYATAFEVIDLPRGKPV